MESNLKLSSVLMDQFPPEVLFCGRMCRFYEWLEADAIQLKNNDATKEDLLRNRVFWRGRIVFSFDELETKTASCAFVPASPSNTNFQKRSKFQNTVLKFWNTLVDMHLGICSRQNLFHHCMDPEALWITQRWHLCSQTPAPWSHRRITGQRHTGLGNFTAGTK